MLTKQSAEDIKRHDYEIIQEVVEQAYQNGKAYSRWIRGKNALAEYLSTSYAT
ncbi:hypothetical protein MOO44_00585 (plasmid) [Nicoliella spurrieriana]|uniref:Uncharacterized protein n=2 Tax=Nicoliella spurrieriana TaxID=2925830 RepID=A0A976RR13_9LACO|nr:hypothetical protein MOO44_00585 [Nicoliella spurrieriana]